MTRSAEQIVIPDSELAPFVPGAGEANKARALLAQQKGAWEMLRTGYDTLQSVRTKAFEFDGFQIKVQFNPGRMTSTAAKVDATSIRERKCFLCLENLPAAQRGIPCDGDYLVLCNPFPIFPEHFTIPTRQHVPQRILGSFATLLNLTQALGDRYTVFYNGPRCGASAPDHLHFQAGNRAFLPIDTEYEALKRSGAGPLFESAGLRAYGVDGLRRFVSFESSDPSRLQRAFAALHEVLGEGATDSEEPLLNILGFWQNGAWRIIVFPRLKHRPAFYFKEGDEQLLISPAAVEMGGICTTPREQDFEKVTREHLVGMYQEVCIPEEKFVEQKARLTLKLKALA